MTQNEKIRKMVSTAYEKAICSTTTGCGCSAREKTAGMAGYKKEDITVLNSDAAASSFGCGNPLAFSDVKKGDTILDLGSGAGFDLIIAARKVGQYGHVIGVDMTRAMIEKARQNIRAEGLTNVDVRFGIIEELPVESASADWVISNCVINLSPEKERVFSEIHRVLKPGGKLLVSDIVVTNLPDEFPSNDQVYSACVGGAISEEDYIKCLGQAGLINIDVRNRFVYDAPQIKGFFETQEIPGLKEMINDQPEQDPADLIEQMSIAAAGKIWSAEFYAEKPTIKIRRTDEEIITRMIQLAESRYNCSQIMTILTLEQTDHNNPGLVRAMSGLGEGCGFFNETCGIKTSAVSLLAWYGGKGSDSESESKSLLPMIQDLEDWFGKKTASYKGTRCKDIVGAKVGTPAGKQICGALIFDTFNKLNEILRSYGSYEPKQPGCPGQSPSGSRYLRTGGCG